LWEKGLNVKDIHKEMFPVYGGKCLSRKAVHNWVADLLVMTMRRNWLRQHSKDFFAAGFEALVMQWDKYMC
jgi:hypothetical protein